MSHSSDQIIVNRFKEYLELNVGNYELIDLEEAALFAMASYSRLKYCCKHILGRPPGQIVAEAYLDKAIYLSKEKGVNENEISDRLGFTNLSGFCHFIKKHTKRNFKSYLLLLKS